MEWSLLIGRIFEVSYQGYIMVFEFFFKNNRFYDKKAGTKK